MHEYAPVHAGPRDIRPPDPLVRTTTLAYMRIRSAEACRRLAHLAFRDASSALDLTYAAGHFWREPLPPGLAVTSNNLDPAAPTDLHLDFTRTGLTAGAYDLVVYDPPHLADGGSSGIMAEKYGTIRTTASLRELIVAGAREAARVAAVGVVVKVTEHSHGGRFLDQSAWVSSALGTPYFKLSTLRPSGLVASGRWRAERVPRSNGAVYLVYRHDGRGHVDFDALWRRQALHLPVPSGAVKLCCSCNAALPAGRSDRATCSSACRQRAYRERRRV
jgi:hypothetical protein